MTSGGIDAPGSQAGNACVGYNVTPVDLLGRLLVVVQSYRWSHSSKIRKVFSGQRNACGVMPSKRQEEDPRG